MKVTEMAERWGPSPLTLHWRLWMQQINTIWNPQWFELTWNINAEVSSSESRGFLTRWFEHCVVWPPSVPCNPAEPSRVQLGPVLVTEQWNGGKEDPQWSRWSAMSGRGKESCQILKLPFSKILKWAELTQSWCFTLSSWLELLQSVNVWNDYTGCTVSKPQALSAG